MKGLEELEEWFSSWIGHHVAVKNTNKLLEQVFRTTSATLMAHTMTRFFYVHVVDGGGGGECGGADLELSRAQVVGRPGRVSSSSRWPAGVSPPWRWSIWGTLTSDIEAIMGSRCYEFVASEPRTCGEMLPLCGGDVKSMGIGFDLLAELYMGLRALERGLSSIPAFVRS